MKHTDAEAQFIDQPLTVGGEPFESAGLAEAVAARGLSIDDVVNNPMLIRRPRLGGSPRLLALDALPDRLWRSLDETVVEEGPDILNAVLSVPRQAVENPMGTTELEVPRVDEERDTHQGMDPEAAVTTERLDYTSITMPLPFTWIRYKFPAQMDATRLAYVSQVIANGQKALMYALERLMFEGTGSYNGRTAQGLDSSSITATAGGSSKWNDTGKNSEEYLNEWLAAYSRLVGQRRFGALTTLVHPTVGPVIQRDYTVTSRSTVREASETIQVRLNQSGANIRRSSGIQTATTVYVVETGGDTIKWAEAMGVSVIQWVSPGQFMRHVLILAKAAPVVVPTHSGVIGAQRIT